MQVIKKHAILEGIINLALILCFLIAAIASIVILNQTAVGLEGFAIIAYLVLWIILIVPMIMLAISGIGLCVLKKSVGVGFTVVGSLGKVIALGATIYFGASMVTETLSAIPYVVVSALALAALVIGIVSCAMRNNLLKTLPADSAPVDTGASVDEVEEYVIVEETVEETVELAADEEVESAVASDEECK